MFSTKQKIRLAVYLFTGVGTIVVVYAEAKGWAGGAEKIAWGSFTTLVLGLAGINVRPGQDGVEDTHETPIIDWSGDVDQS